MDLRIALEWVRDNVENFGGDPENVTIFGQSGGGAKVSTMMAMPSAKGLFDKAINQSGAYVSGFMEKKETQAVGDQLLQILDIHPANIDTLQKIPYPVLVEAARKAQRLAAQKLRAEGVSVPGRLGWGPSLDGDLLPYQFASEEVDELWKNIPLMIGSVKNEFVTSLNVGLADATETEVMEYIKNRWKDNTDEYLAAVKEAYPNDTLPSDLIDVDFLFRRGALAIANRKSAVKDGAPVYMYLFGWQSPALDGKFKAWHCMEIPFVFDNIHLNREMTGAGPETYVLAKKMNRAWINFARTGNPNTSELPTWDAYTTLNGTTMFFDNESKVVHHHDKTLMDFVANN